MFPPTYHEGTILTIYICPTGTGQSILSLTLSYTEMIHG